MVVKFVYRATALAVAAILPFVVLAGPDKPCTVASQDKAKDMLRRALTNGDRIALNAVVVQRVSSDMDGPFQFTMTQDTNGRRRMVAVKPLVVQGMVSIDDGRQWVNFYPDENRMVVMPSPRGDREDVEARLKLAFQNYRFAIEPRTRIAGRSATVVVAVPRFASMPVRRFTIDDSSNVLLRVEAFPTQGAREVFFDTKAIQFATTAASIDLSLHEEPATRVFRPEPPVRIKRLADAKAHTGFAPVALRTMPNGFEPREMLVVGHRNAKYLAMRLTDGLVSATLYQFPASRAPLGRHESNADFTHQGVTLRLVGEVSDDVRLKMVSSIAKSYGRTLGTMREPVAPVQTLSPKRMPEPEFEIFESMVDELAQWIEEMIFSAFNDIDPVIAAPSNPTTPRIR